jgi:hypothetical protein
VLHESTTTAVEHRQRDHRSRTVALLLVGGLLAGLLSTGAARAASILEFDLWMQRIDRHSQDVLRHLARQEAPAALVDARELAALYRSMEGFYAERGHADDAELAAFVGRDHAESAVQAIQRGALKEAADEASALARECRDCHIRFKPIRP